MTSPSSESTHEQRINAIVQAYLDAVAAGEEPDVEKILSAHEDIADYLRSFFQDDQAMRQRMQALDTPEQSEPGSPATSEFQMDKDPDTAPRPQAQSTVGPERATVAEELPSGDIGDYELSEKLGEGGMGHVYKARHVRLKRIVALKMIATGSNASEAELTRFRIEAEAVARLQHPGIVQIFEVGQHEGQPFLALEFCSGGSLEQRFRQGSIPPEEAAEMVRTLALAIEAAHLQNVIHRDLKPANVLLTEEGQLKITDFGLAKRLDEGEQVTQSNAIVGTPAYMAPEQGTHAREIGPATDVYALGAILYEMLTGRPPFQQATPLDTILSVIQDAPVRPRVINAKLPRDLETICLKCLEKDPNKRYASANDLAEELERFSEKKPILARPIGRMERAWRWTRRYPTVSILTLTILLVLIAGTTVSAVLAIKEARAKRNAVKLAGEKARLATQKSQLADEKSRLAKVEAETSASLRDSIYAKDLRDADTALQEKDVERVLSLLEKYVPKPGQIDRRCFAWYHLKAQCSAVKGIPYRGDPQLYSIALSPDRKTLAVAQGESEKVVVCDADTGKVRWEVKVKNKPFEVHFSPDGKTLAVACGKGATRYPGEYSYDGVLLLNARADNAQEARKTSIDSVGVCAAFSPARKGEFANLLACGMREGAIRLWDLQKQQTVGVLTERARRPVAVEKMVFAPGGNYLISASRNGAVKIWDVKTRTVVRNLTNNTPAVKIVDAYYSTSWWRKHPLGLAVSPNGKYLVTAVKSPKLHLWSLKNFRLLKRMSGHTDAISSVAFTPDSERFVSTSLDSEVRVWSVNSTEGRRLGSHRDVASAVVVTTDGTEMEVLSGGDEGVVRRWSLPGSADDSQAVVSARGTSGIQFAVAVSPNGKKVISGGWHGELPRVTSLAFSPDGQFYARGHGDEKRVQVRNASSGDLVWEVEHNTWVSHVSYSPDGTQLAVSDDEAVTIYDAKRPEVIHVLDSKSRPEEPPGFEGRRFTDQSGTFSPRGTWLAIREKPGIVLWDAKTYQRRQEITSDKISCPPVFSADGRLLAFCKDRTEIVIWSTQGKRVLHRIPAHFAAVVALAFCPDGKTLASVGEDSRCVLWDLVTRQPKIILRGHSAELRALAFSADGKVLATTGIDRQVRTWRAPGLTRPGEQYTDQLVARAEAFRRVELEQNKAGASVDPALPKPPPKKDLGEQDPETWRARAMQACATWNWKLAAENYAQVLKLKPDDVPARIRLAQCSLQAANVNEYEKQRIEILKRLPHGDAQAVQVCSLMPLKGTVPDKLLETAKLVEEANPNQWQSHYAKAGVLYRMGQYKEALTVLEHLRPLCRNPMEKVRMQLWLALTHQQLQEPLAARQNLTAVRKGRRSFPQFRLPLTEQWIDAVVDFEVLHRQGMESITPPIALVPPPAPLLPETPTEIKVQRGPCLIDCSFKWSKVKSASHYEIALYPPNSRRGSLMVKTREPNFRYVTLYPKVVSGEYRWQVRAIISEIPTGWSSPGYLKFKTPDGSRPGGQEGVNIIVALKRMAPEQDKSIQQSAEPHKLVEWLIRDCEALVPLSAKQAGATVQIYQRALALSEKAITKDSQTYLSWNTHARLLQGLATALAVQKQWKEAGRQLLLAMQAQKQAQKLGFRDAERAVHTCTVQLKGILKQVGDPRLIAQFWLELAKDDNIATSQGNRIAEGLLDCWWMVDDSKELADEEKKALKKGYSDEALRQIKKYSDQNADDEKVHVQFAEALAKLANAAVAENQLDEARLRVEQAIEQHAKAMKAGFLLNTAAMYRYHVQLAGICVKQGDYEKAAQMWLQFSTEDAATANDAYASASGIFTCLRSAAKDPSLSLKQKNKLLETWGRKAIALLQRNRFQSEPRMSEWTSSYQTRLTELSTEMKQFDDALQFLRKGDYASAAQFWLDHASKSPVKNTSAATEELVKCLDLAVKDQALTLEQKMALLHQSGKKLVGLHGLLDRKEFGSTYQKASFLSALAGSLSELSEISQNMNQLKDVIGFLQEAVALERKARNLHYTRARNDSLKKAHARLIQLLMQQHRYADVMQIQLELAAGRPERERTSAARQVMGTLRELAKDEKRTIEDRKKLIDKWGKEAGLHLEGLPQTGLRKRTYHNRLIQHQRDLSEIYLSIKQFEEARNRVKQAFELEKTLGSTQPGITFPPPRSGFITPSGATNTTLLTKILMAQGNHAEAVKTWTDFAAKVPKSFSHAYAAAKGLLTCRETVEKDSELDMKKREQLMEDYAAKAVLVLSNAHKSGAKLSPTRLRTLSPLNPLQPRKDFQQLLKDLMP